MGWNTVPMAMHALRLQGRPADLHQADGSDSSHSSLTRPPLGGVHGRHSAPLLLGGRSLASHDHLSRVTRSLRLLSEHEEVRSDPNPGHRLSWGDRFIGNHAVLTSTREVTCTTESGQVNAHSRTGWEMDTTTDAPASSRSPPVSVRLHPPMPSALQCTDRGATHCTRAVPHSSVPTRNLRVDMVGTEHHEMEREGDHSRSPLSSVRHGRIGHGLGSSLLPPQLATHRLPRLLHFSDEQQYARTNSGTQRSPLPSSSTEMERLFYSRSNRQSVGHGIRQPHGGPLTPPLQDCGTDPFLLPVAPAITHRGVPPGSAEHGSGLAVAHRDGFLGSTAQSIDFSIDQSGVGSPHHRSLRLGHQLAASPLRELSSGPTLPVFGRAIAPRAVLAPREPLVFSPGSPGSRNDSKGGGGAADSHPHHPSLAQPALVAAPLASLPGLALPSPPPPGSHAVVVGGQASGGSNPLGLGRSSLIRQAMLANRIPDTAVDLFFWKNKHGESAGTNQQHNKRWDRYAAWCATSGRRPIDFEIADILCYVSEVLLGVEKVSSGVCNNFVSMMSITKEAMLPGSPVIALNPIVIGFKKGVRRQRPPKSKSPGSYYSLWSVFEFLLTLSTDDATCSLEHLRTKLIVLLAIDGMARASDLASINRDTIRSAGNRLHFHYYSTKESKNMNEIPMSIAAYGMNMLLCTVSVTMAYLSRTRDLTIAPTQQWNNGVLTSRRPLIISSFRNDDLKYFALDAQRIAKLGLFVLRTCGVTDFTFHSFRGSSSSKVVNLGGDLSLVLARARWASEATFRKNYFRAKVYLEVSPLNRKVLLEILLRMKTEKV
jgi:integrase